MGFYFNDRGMAEGFNNLSGLFRQPTAQDVYAQAKAQAERDDIERKRQLWDYSRSPGYTRQGADPMLEMLGLVTGTTSNTAQDMNDATKQRGDNLTFQASRLNTGDNNVRALAQTGLEVQGRADNTAANNIRELDVAKQNNDERFREARYGAVAEGSTLPAVPPEIAALTNTPVNPGFSGNIKVGQGQIVQPALGGAPIVGMAPSVTPEQALGGQVAAAFPSFLAGKDPPTGMGPVMNALLRPAATSNVGKIFADAANDPAHADVYNQAATQEAAGSKAAEPTVVALQNRRDTLTAQGVPPTDPRIIEINKVLAGTARGPAGQTEAEKVRDRDVMSYDKAIVDNGDQTETDAILHQMKQAMSKDVQTGGLAETNLAIRKSANWLGFDGGDTSPEENMKSLGDAMALKLRNLGGSNSMPGSLSDSDRAFLVGMAPGLSASPEANAKLVDYYQRVSDRAKLVAKMRNDYIRTHGIADEDMRLKISDYVNTHPLFPEAETNADGTPKVSSPGVTATPNPSAPGAPVGTAKEIPAPAPSGAVAPVMQPQPMPTAEGHAPGGRPRPGVPSVTAAPPEGATGTYKGVRVVIKNGVPVDVVTGQPVP